MKDKKILKMQQQIDDALSEINELLMKGLVDKANDKYSKLIRTIERNDYDTLLSLKGTVYISFAFFLFGTHKYGQFFEMLIKAQDCGYSKEEIENILLEAFIEPNINDFQTIYEANIEFLISKEYLMVEKPLGFHELPYWLLPTENANEYFMYDKKQKQIKEKISLFNYHAEELISTTDEFADYLLIEDWNWDSILTYTNTISKRNKKTYVLLDNLVKTLSCLQGAMLDHNTLSNILILENLETMEEYFKSTYAFLPRNIINGAGKSLKYQDTFNRIHNYRLGKENRKGDNILLSICIPSFNRGNRAYENILHLLRFYYDEEIEIILSNNGTQNETKDFYDKIRDIADARLVYHAFDENQGYAVNCCKVCELAQGKYILIVSDEDLVDFNVLHEVMNILNKFKDPLAIMRTSTSHQSKPPTRIVGQGRDALLTFMLSSNYVSGMIFNNGLLKKYKGIEYIKENLNNSACFYYPHMIWELILSQYGIVMGSNLILINEGEAEKTEVPETEIGRGEIVIPYYTTIEGRLEQHEGFFRVICSLEIVNFDFNLLREMYLKLCAKTLFLVSITINVFYRKTESNLIELLEKAYNFCAREDFFYGHIRSNRDNYLNDLKIINTYFDHCKNQIQKL